MALMVSRVLHELPGGLYSCPPLCACGPVAMAPSSLCCSVFGLCSATPPPPGLLGAHSLANLPFFHFAPIAHPSPHCGTSSFPMRAAPDSQAGSVGAPTPRPGLLCPVTQPPWAAVGAPCLGCSRVVHLDFQWPLLPPVSTLSPALPPFPLSSSPPTPHPLPCQALLFQPTWCLPLLRKPAAGQWT